MSEKHAASLAIQILPTIQGDGEVVRVVDEVIAYIKGTGLHTFVGPFETTVEGDLDTIMDIVRQSVLIADRAGASSVASYMKLFYNPTAGVMSIDQKVTKHHE